MLWWLLGSEVFIEEKKVNAPISGRVSVTETLDLGSIPCLAFSNNKEQCVVDRWTRCGSLTRRPKGSFAVSWSKQLGEYNKITKIIDH